MPKTASSQAKANRQPCPPSPELVTKMRQMLSEHKLHLRWLAYDTGLVAINAKPASLEAFWRSDSEHLFLRLGRDDWWEATELIEILRQDGVFVIEVPASKHFSDLAGRKVTWLFFSRDAKRAQSLVRLFVPPGQKNNPARNETTEIRRGLLLGYVRSGCLAFLGRLPEADRPAIQARLSPNAKRFPLQIVAAGSTNEEESLARAEWRAAAFSAAFGC